ncbi:MAG TPA: DUF4175 family protein, partial [Gemmatimonadales bacterium]|nr:DUF4175 family protein [Gemmatimonadales bacterium]
MSRTATILAAQLHGLRRLATTTTLLTLLGSVALLLGLAAWGLRLGWMGQPWWVLVAWSLVLGALAVTAWLGYRALVALSSEWLASQFERAGFRLGALRAHLGPSAQGTSEELLAAADASQAQELEARGPALLNGLRTPLQKRTVQSGALLLGAAIVLLAAGPTRGAPARLWHPAEAWSATIAPLAIAVSATEVERGKPVTVSMLARGRQRAILWTRAPGEGWKGQGIVLDSTGRAQATLTLENDLFLRLTSGGRNSDTLQVKVRIPAFLGTLTVTARYPNYLRLEDEPIPTSGDTVLVPEGTRLETVGEATADLRNAEWLAGAGRNELTVKGRTFLGVFVPSGTRSWELALTSHDGQRLAGDTVRIPIVTVPDSAPTVDVPVPGADTLVPVSLRVQLVVDAQDDHGLSQVVVESHRVSRLGFADPVRRETIALPSGGTDRAILPWELDLNQRNLLPGDTVKFTVQVSDNAPRAHVTRSREYVLRLPTLSEIRAAARETGQSIGAKLDSIAEASKKLERQTEDLAQERPRGSDRNGTGNESLSYDAAKKAEQVSEQQEQLLKDAEAVKQALEALKQGAEAAGMNDPEWQKKLQEIQEQLERALTPELRERLAELQAALKDLDPERTRDALEKLAEAQKELREALERSKELFERAALEGDMQNLTAEARDLAQQQQQWSEQVANVDSTRAAKEEQALSARADSLSAALKQLAEQVGEKSPARKDGLQQAATKAQQAANQMKQASQSAQRGQKPQAKQQGQQAQQNLEPLGDQLEQQSQQMAAEWREEVIQALDRTMADASRMAERQLAVSEQFRRGDATAGTRAEQGAIEEGTERLVEQAQELSGKNALVSPQASTALAQARDNMRKAREALASGAPNTREASRRAQEAVDALNAAAFSMLRSRGSVSGSESGSGLQEAMEQMSQMAQQQGNMGQQAAGMLPQMGNGGMQEQLRQLAAQQRAMSERLERMRAGGQIPGAADMAQEAKDLARSMEAGRLDRQTVERQERLFRRMLDAGRTLQGEEKDEKQERQSNVGKEDSVRLPPALRARLNDNDALLRYPSWEELQALSPEER